MTLTNYHIGIFKRPGSGNLYTGNIQPEIPVPSSEPTPAYQKPVITVKRERSPTPPPLIDPACTVPCRPYKIAQRNVKPIDSYRPARDERVHGDTTQHIEQNPSPARKIKVQVESPHINSSSSIERSAEIHHTGHPYKSHNAISSSPISHPPASGTERPQDRLSQITVISIENIPQNSPQLANTSSSEGSPTINDNHTLLDHQTDTPVITTLPDIIRQEPTTRNGGKNIFKSDCRIQQNRASAAENVVLQKFLADTKSTLDKVKISDEQQNVQYHLRKILHSKRMDQYYYSKRIQKKVDSLSKYFPERKAIEKKAMIEVGLEVLNDCFASCSHLPERSNLLANYRILISGDWKKNSIIGKLIVMIGRLGGFKCHDRAELFRGIADKYIDIVDLNPLDNGPAYAPLTTKWEIISCIQHFVKLCKDLESKHKPLEDKLKSMVGWCKKDQRESGKDKAIFVCPLVKEKYRTPIIEIANCERIMICHTIRLLQTFPRNRYIIDSDDKFTNNTSTIDLSRDMTHISAEGFYNLIDKSRKAIPRNTELTRRKAKELPPIIQTGPRQER